MKIKKEFLESKDETLLALVKHFEYSVKDIQSYSELTPKEKEIMSPEVFESLTE